jgi:hypothetical protein
MKIKNYRQSTCESCLASCLLQLRRIEEGEDFSKYLEQKMLFYAFRFDRDDWVSGHLDFLYKNLGFRSVRFVHTKILFDRAKRVKGNEVVQEKIDLKLIDSALDRSPVIVLIDFFVLRRWCHTPHWILIYGKKGSRYEIYEPWEGKNVLVEKAKIRAGLSSLLLRLWMAPQMITLEKKMK